MTPDTNSEKGYEFVTQADIEKQFEECAGMGGKWSRLKWLAERILVERDALFEMHLAARCNHDPANIPSVVREKLGNGIWEDARRILEAKRG